MPRPFSSGTQYASWTFANCEHCKHGYLNNDEQFVCEIEKAINLALIGDGNVTDKIADRMGYRDDEFLYLWQCGEFAPIE